MNEFIYIAIIYIAMAAPFCWHLFNRTKKLILICSIYSNLSVIQKIFYIFDILYVALYSFIIVYLYFIIDSGIKYTAGGGAIFAFMGPVIFIPLSIILELLLLPLNSILPVNSSPKKARFTPLLANYGVLWSQYEAKNIIKSELNKYLKTKYSSLVELIGSIDESVTKSPSGTSYYIQTLINWHDQGKGIISVKSFISKENNPPLYEKEIYITQNGIVT